MEAAMSCKQARMKNHSIITEFAAFYLAFFFSFGYLFNMYYLAVLLLFISIFLSCIGKKAVNPRLLGSLSLLGTIWLISSLYSYEMSLAIKYTLFCIVVFLSLILLNREVFERSFRYIMILCMIHISIVLIQYFSYSTIDVLARKILSKAYYTQAKVIYNYCGALAGITGQTGQVALYCVAFILGVDSYAKQKKFFYVFLIPAFIALILTQKRSFLFISAALTMVSVLSDMKQATRKKKVILGVLVFASVALGYYLIASFFDVSNFFDKVEKGSLSNRDVLWREMIALFVENPIFGVGFYSTDILLGMTGHNIYLQLLCENGLIGAVPFYVSIIYFSCFVLRLKTKKTTSNSFKLNYLFMILYGFLGNPIYEFTHIIIILMSIVYLKNNERMDL